jgi:3-oxoacyl-[acyl-carrier protein] reductase
MTQSNGRRIALVTGGTSGIGRCVAHALRDDGFEVVVMARSPAALDRMAKEGFIAARGDVGDEQAVEAVAADVDRRFSRLDALVHCAGIVESEPATSITTGSIARQVQINLVGTMLVNLAALPLLEREGGSIVNFSTTLVHTPMAGASVYAATKAGVEAFSRSLALEVGPAGIRVNVVAPSLVRSNIWLAAGMSADAYERLLTEKAAEYPLGRTGTPEDVAALVRFLVAPEARWITGAVLPVDGGRLLGVARRASP